MHHKRKRPKNRRAGCLLCKPWKASGASRLRPEAEAFSAHRRRVTAEVERRAALTGRRS
jgi:hypothetical protein